MFKYVIENDLMPPWTLDSTTGPWKNNFSLTPKEKTMLLKWVDDGCPKKSGETKALWTKAKKIKSAKGEIVRLPEMVEIPSEGFYEYKRFVIQTNFKGDKWIKNVDFFVKPKVIHHMWLFIMDQSFPANEDVSHINLRDYVTKGFGIGNSEREAILNKNVDDENIGYKLLKNSKLVFEIHYESIGRKVTDDYTHVRLNFHERKPKYKKITYTLETSKIKISPHDSNYKIKMSYKLKKTKQLVSIGSHMHLRGKASSLYVISPDGERKRIFGVDPYLFKFQTVYELRSPLTVVGGSTLECINWYDNSISNPVNPDPKEYVTRGRFIKDEMSECHIGFIVSSDSRDRSTWIKTH